MVTAEAGVVGGQHDHHGVSPFFFLFGGLSFLLFFTSGITFRYPFIPFVMGFFRHGLLVFLFVLCAFFYSNILLRVVDGWLGLSIYKKEWPSFFFFSFFLSSVLVM